MNAIWGAGMMSLTKLIIVVDADCDVHDYSEVAWRAFGNVDYAHDLLHDGGPGRPPRPRVLPAVLGRQGRHRRDRKLAEEGYTRGWPEMIAQDPAIVAQVNRRWKESGL